MTSRGPIWHALAGLLFVSGCYDMHGVETDTGVDTIDERILDASWRDAPSIDTPADTSSWTDAGSVCDDVVAQLRLGVAPESIGCDGRTFPEGCVVDVGLCCTVFVGCASAPGDGGHVTTEMSCTDLCAQTCTDQPLEDCALYSYCERFEPDACGPAPEGIIEGPACIDRRGAPCEDDEACALGETCRSYWVHPCPGGRCAACGSEERRCAR